jgi:hypothetical protein
MAISYLICINLVLNKRYKKPLFMHDKRRFFRIDGSLRGGETQVNSG